MRANLPKTINVRVTICPANNSLNKVWLDVNLPYPQNFYVLRVPKYAAVKVLEGLKSEERVKFVLEANAWGQAFADPDPPTPGYITSDVRLSWLLYLSYSRVAHLALRCDTWHSG